MRPTLARGSTDKEAVKELQALLNKSGERLTVDGDYGPATEGAVKGFQTSYGLAVTGKVDSSTWLYLDKTPYAFNSHYASVALEPLTAVTGNSGVAKAWNAYGGLLQALGADLGVSPCVACAVLAVESAGSGFWNKRLVIRFENHVFWSRWGKNHADVYSQHFKKNATQGWLDHEWRPGVGAWRKLHTKEAGQNEEWAVLKYARTLDDTAALKSISMGAPQIMGFNYDKIGYDSPQEMFAFFQKGDRPHVLGLFDFIRSNHKMVRALRAGDWKGFAYIYNGSGQADDYGAHIAQKVADAQKLGIP